MSSRSSQYAANAVSRDMMSKRHAEATEARALSNSSASASAVSIVPVGGGALVL